MGTRCLTVFVDDDGISEIAVLYRQFDGYPDGHGLRLKEWAGDRYLVNGLIGNDNEVWNGMGCLAADCVAHFKKKTGGFYLYPANTRDVGEDYIYTLSKKEITPTHVEGYTRERWGLWLKVQDSAKSTVYEGWIKEFDSDAILRI